MIAPWQHFTPRFGTGHSGAAMTPLDKNGRPVTSVRGAIDALQERTTTEVVSFRQVNAQPFASKADAIAKQESLFDTDADFPVLHVKQGNLVMAFDRQSISGSTSLQLVLTLKMNKGWIPINCLGEVIHQVEVQVRTILVRHLKLCWCNQKVAESTEDLLCFEIAITITFRGR
jgi:hypothetical protein